MGPSHDVARDAGRGVGKVAVRGQRFPWADLALSLAIFGVVWLTRSLAASAFVTWDEPAWVYRSVRFLTALAEGDLRGTLLVGHPGVLTMWTGALSLAWGLVTGAVSQSQLAAASAIKALDVHDPAALTLLVDLLPTAKVGISVVHASIAVGLFWLLERLLDRRYALVGTLLLVTDPYYLAMSRVLHMDALTSGLMLASVLAALVFVREGCRRYLVISAVAAGMAAVTKSYGVLVAPYVGLLLLYSLQRTTQAGKSRLLATVRDGGFWGGIATATFVLLWPSMWVAPIGTLREVLGLSLSYAADPGDATTAFFLGVTTSTPGAIFYPVMLYFRATPLVLVGAALALLGLAVRPAPEDPGANRRWLTWALLGYGILYLVVITLSAKKFGRYMLPATLALDMLAMLGLVGTLDTLARAASRSLRSAGWLQEAGTGTLACLLVVASAGALLGPLAPAHYLAYYNPWAGGLSEATKSVPVGWGEGLEQVAAYLTGLPEAEDTVVATWSVAAIAPSFPGRVTTLTAENLPAADYVLLYLGDIQASLPLAERFYGQERPEFVARVCGVEYAWLYRNVCAEEVARGLAQVNGDADLVVLDRHSTFDRHSNAWAVAVMEAGPEASVIDQLNAALDHHQVGAGQDVWYVRYDDENVPQIPDPDDLVQRHLQRNGLLLGRQRFACGTISRYRLLSDRFVPLTADRPQDAVLNGQLLLDSYGLSQDQLEYRQTVGLALAWQVLQPVPEDYHLFVHLLDERDRKWGQRDVPLCDTDGICASAWEVGSTHTVDLDLGVEPGTVPGPYRLVTGLYRMGDSARLPVLDVAGKRVGDEVALASLTVGPSTVPADPADLPIPHPMDAQFGEQVQVLGYGLPENVRSGEDVALDLFWQCLEDVKAPWDLVLRLAQGGRIVHEVRGQPAGESYPTDRWSTGDVFHAVHVFRVPSDLESGLYDVQANLCDAGGRCLAGEDVLMTSLEVEHVERLFDVPEMRYPFHARLGGTAELLGYDLDEALEPGGPLRLTLFWRALETPEVSFTVFTHLLDAARDVRGQRDSVPVGGQRPTTGWVQGEVIVDSYEISVDADAPVGVYQVEVGLYDPATGERLPVILADATSDPDRRVLLPQPVTVY
ncbi:MAG: glycosyltransferase family 39 protein [Anaerolineae bacterium]